MGTVDSGDSVTEHASNGLASSDSLSLDGLALEGGLSMGRRGLLLESNELLVGDEDGLVEVGLGHLRGGANGVEHLLLHLGAGLLGLEGESLDGGVGLGAELGDLSRELVVDDGADILVHLSTTLLDELGNKRYAAHLKNDAELHRLISKD